MPDFPAFRLNPYYTALRTWLTTALNDDGTIRDSAVQAAGASVFADKTATEAALLRIDPGVAGTRGAALVQGTSSPAFAPTRIIGWAEGIRSTETAANNATRLADVIAYAGASAGNPVIIELGGDLSFNGATVNIPDYIQLVGWGPNPSNRGTTLNDLSITIGASAAVAHGVALQDFVLRNSPSHSIQWLGLMGEHSWMDRITVTDAMGDSFRLDEGGVPQHIGSLASFRAAGAGLRNLDVRNVMRIEYLSGDDNTDGLLVLDGYDTTAAGIMLIDAIKSEANFPVIDIVDAGPSRLFVHVLSVANAPASGNGTIPVIRQQACDRSTYVQVDATTVSDSGTHSAYYENANTGQSISIDEAEKYGMSTWTRRSIGDYGTHESPQPVITGTVGTVETALAHGLFTTPSVVSIVLDTDARVWESSPPDANHVYLTASASTGATITLDRSTPATAGTIAVHDTFTGSNGTAIGSHSPDVGGTWTASAAAIQIQSNQLQFQNGFRHARIDASSADVILRATLNLGQFTATRAFGFLFRYVDSNNYWFAHLTLAGGATAGYLRVVERLSGVETTIGGTPNVVMAENTDLDVMLTIRGTSLVAVVDGVEVQRTTLTSSHSTATIHGLVVGVFGTNTTAPDADDFYAWAV